ncbi:MAG: AAA family ATPase, partial [Acidobacteriota bacterium]
LFGAPLAYEDHARRAVLAALGIQRKLKEGHAALGAQLGVELAVRVGLNTGLVVVGAVGDTLRMDYTAVGGTTNMAARLQQLAEPGAIYISESTHRAVQDHFDCRSLGKQMVKGRVEPILVYEVFGVRAYSGSVARRTIDGLGSPLVGRDPEFATFNRCIDRLCARRGGIMWVIGEAGLGKSRLVAEVRRQTAGNEPLWLEGPTRSFGQTISYWPFLEIIKTYVGIDEDDRAGESWAKLEGRITALFPDEVAEILPYLATLMSLEVRGEMAERVKYLDEEAMGRQIFRASRRFFERLAQEDPLVLVFEDLHWVDQSSADLLEHLMPLVRKVPLLICGISRPDRQTPAAHLREIAATAYLDGYTEIYLSPLLPPDSASLARNLLEMHDSSSGVHDLIMQKAEGNPFFMEEVIRSLIVMGVVLRDQATGKWRATVQPQEIDIPDTIQAVILARIDRLQEDVKQVLKVASVIGRSFFYRVLSTLVEDEQKLDRCLDELQQVELIQERRRMPELEYIFKHTLVQEATYESILLDRRRQLHRRVGECIETLFADRLEEEFSGVLAYHYVRAEEWEKAHDYLLKAGDQSGKVAADTEALAHYRQALAAYTRAFGERWDALQRAMLERKMGEALFRRGEHQQAAEYLERALASLGSPYPTSRWGIRLAIVRQLARQAGHRLLPGLFLRQKADVADPTAEDRSRIYIVLAWIDYFINVKRLVLDSLMQLNLCEQRALPAGVVRGAMALGVSCDLIPIFWLGRQYHHRAVALAEQIQHPVAIAYAYLGLGSHEYHQGK